jgi:PEP-CTERM motif-containing protein
LPRARVAEKDSDVTKQLLFLTAVLVSLPIPILGNEAGFQTPGSAVGFAPEHFPTAVIFNESLAGARVRAYPTRHASGQNEREAWRYTLSGPVIGNGESVIGSGAEQDVDVSGAHGLSSIVKIDDGAISISVPEPGTMTTLGTGLATIAFLIRKKRQVHSFLH